MTETETTNDAIAEQGPADFENIEGLDMFATERDTHAQEEQANRHVEGNPEPMPDHERSSSSIADTQQALVERFGGGQWEETHAATVMGRFDFEKGKIFHSKSDGTEEDIGASIAKTGNAEFIKNFEAQMTALQNGETWMEIISHDGEKITVLVSRLEGSEYVTSAYTTTAPTEKNEKEEKNMQVVESDIPLFEQDHGSDWMERATETPVVLAAENPTASLPFIFQSEPLLSAQRAESTPTIFWIDPQPQTARVSTTSFPVSSPSWTHMDSSWLPPLKLPSTESSTAATISNRSEAISPTSKKITDTVQTGASKTKQQPNESTQSRLTSIKPELTTNQASRDKVFENRDYTPLVHDHEPLKDGAIKNNAEAHERRIVPPVTHKKNDNTWESDNHVVKRTSAQRQSIKIISSQRLFASKAVSRPSDPETRPPQELSASGNPFFPLRQNAGHSPKPIRSILTPRNAERPVLASQDKSRTDKTPKTSPKMELVLSGSKLWTRSSQREAVPVLPPSPDSFPEIRILEDGPERPVVHTPNKAVSVIPAGREAAIGVAQDIPAAVYRTPERTPFTEGPIKILGNTPKENKHAKLQAKTTMQQSRKSFQTVNPVVRTPASPASRIKLAPQGSVTAPRKTPIRPPALREPALPRSEAAPSRANQFVEKISPLSRETATVTKKTESITSRSNREPVRQAAMRFAPESAIKRTPLIPGKTVSMNGPRGTSRPIEINKRAEKQEGELIPSPLGSSVGVVADEIFEDPVSNNEAYSIVRPAA